MKRIMLALAATVAASIPAWAGLHYEAVTRSVSDDDKTTQEFVVEAWVEGEKARIEFRESKGSPVPKGGYLVTTDGGRTMFMVNPKDREYMRWDLDAMLQSLTAVMEASGGMVSFEFTNTKFEEQGSNPGPDILGYGTTEHRFHREYRMEMKIIGMRRAYDVKSEEQMWTTTELDAAGLFAWLRKNPPRTGNEGFDSMIASSMQKIEGVPLKTVSRSVMVDSKGRSQRSVSTMEVTTIGEVSTQDSMFEVPAGYKLVEMPAMAGGAPTASDDDSGGKGVFGLFKKKK